MNSVKKCIILFTFFVNYLSLHSQNERTLSFDSLACYIPLISYESVNPYQPDSYKYLEPILINRLSEFRSKYVGHIITITPEFKLNLYEPPHQENNKKKYYKNILKEFKFSSDYIGTIDKSPVGKKFVIYDFVRHSVFGREDYRHESEKRNYKEYRIILKSIDNNDLFYVVFDRSKPVNKAIGISFDKCEEKQLRLEAAKRKARELKLQEEKKQEEEKLIQEQIERLEREKEDANRRLKDSIAREIKIKENEVNYKKYVLELNRKYGSVNAKLIIDGKVKIGWNKKMCIESWGEPMSVNRTVFKDVVTEQWVYDIRTYLYFKNNILTAIQDGY